MILFLLIRLAFGVRAFDDITILCDRFYHEAAACFAFLACRFVIEDEFTRRVLVTRVECALAPLEAPAFDK